LTTCRWRFVRAPKPLPPCSDNPLEDAETLALLAALEQHRWHMTQTAAQLGVSRNTLYRKLRRHGSRETCSRCRGTKAAMRAADRRLLRNPSQPHASGYKGASGLALHQVRKSPYATLPMIYEVDYAHSYSGICGTFMGSMAVLAKELGHHVTGSDANVYPPMSTSKPRALN
jgi:DNA-binding phage protein